MTPSALPPAWAALLAAEFDKPYFKELQAFLQKERGSATVYPPEDQVLSAFSLTSPEQVRVLILGQDPYHGPGQAHGLAFSVAPGIAVPPSLNNMFKELTSDLGLKAPSCGSLIPWARRGVMLLNAVLTVRASEANSHASKGWEKFTDAVIRALSAREQPMVFVLWGGYARKKAKLIDGKKHRILEGTHPSPLSAHQGFFGSKPYSKINALLAELKQPPIDFDLCNAPPEPVKAARPAAPAPAAPAQAAPAAPTQTTPATGQLTLGLPTAPKERRAAPPPPPDGAVLVLAEALMQSALPAHSLPALQRALVLGTWDRLTDAERLTVARAAERALPRAFTLEGVSACQQGASRHPIAFFLHQPDGARFALIPAGLTRLGRGRGAVRMSRRSREGWNKAFQLPAKKGRWDQETIGPELWLERHLSPARSVVLQPYLIEVEPQLRGAALLGKASGADAHQHLQAALLAQGLRLPDGDEWEHACAAGARTLFRWGDEWPVDLALGPAADQDDDDDDEPEVAAPRSPAAKRAAKAAAQAAQAAAKDPPQPEHEPNAFGLRFPGAGPEQPAEATSDPLVFRRGPLPEPRRCFEDQAVHASSWTHDLRALSRPTAALPLLREALLRRVRPLLPPAQR